MTRSPATILVSTIAVAALSGLLPIAGDAQSPKPPATGPAMDGPARHAVILVRLAADLIETRGRERAFEEFRKKGGMFYRGDTYVFVDDMAGKALLNPAFPEVEGKSMIDEKDANGKLLQRAMIDLLREKEEGWVDYMWPKPGETAPSHKWTYVKRVTVDGAPALVGAGIYAE
ncbi:MAG: cache domain-containing protein [Acidobacteria bacterium]|nr:cache domain-containing protein [Acidobacteriota bacterium]